MNPKAVLYNVKQVHFKNRMVTETISHVFDHQKSPWSRQIFCSGGVCGYMVTVIGNGHSDKHSNLAQSAGAVEYTDCTSFEG